MPLRHHLSELESIIAIVDDLLRLDSIADIAVTIAQGFVEIGAVASILLVREQEGEEDRLRVAARWPPEPIDELLSVVRGIEWSEFSIDMADRDNPYVRVLEGGEPALVRGTENIVSHVMATYGANEEAREAIAQTLHGKASVVLPLISAGERLGIAALNYSEDLLGGDLKLFDIFAQSAASMLRFKREVVGRERILADLEQALENERRTRAELHRAERLAALGEMSAVVAHEIRNPLAVIKNSLTSLDRHVDGSKEALLLQRILGEETGRIEHIIEDMLALASPTGSRWVRVSLRAVIAQAVFLAREECGEDEAPIVELLTGPLGTLEGDPQALTQAFVNLLVNAIQAPGSTRVEIAAEQLRSRGIPRARIVFRDDGEGIPGDVVDRVWDPFFTTKPSGTGLGLSVVKRVVDAHGGHVEIDSAEHTGTAATVELPACEDVPRS